MNENEPRIAVLDTGSPRVTAAELPAPRPWRRYFARMIDMFIFSIVIGSLLSLFPIAGLIQNPQLLGLVVIGLMVPYEAGFAAVGWDLPGKQVLAIRVVQQDGSRPGFNLMFRRAMLVWIKGLGFGLPLVSIITMLVAMNDLVINKLSSWDRDCETMVQYGEIGPGRQVALIALVGLFGLLMLSALQLVA